MSPWLTTVIMVPCVPTNLLYGFWWVFPSFWLFTFCSAYLRRHACCCSVISLVESFKNFSIFGDPLIAVTFCSFSIHVLHAKFYGIVQFASEMPKYIEWARSGNADDKDLQKQPKSNIQWNRGQSFLSFIEHFHTWTFWNSF